MRHIPDVRRCERIQRVPKLRVSELMENLMKLYSTITRTVPVLGFVCDIETERKARAEEEDYDFRLISPGYFLGIHDETAYVISEYLQRFGCACQNMTYRLKGNDACKHINAFYALEDYPLNPIDADMAQLLKAAGWIGSKLHPPDLPKPAKKKKLPHAKSPERKPQPQAATRAQKHDEFAGKTTEQIVRGMSNADVIRNAGRGGVACVAEKKRREKAGVI